MPSCSSSSPPFCSRTRAFRRRVAYRIALASDDPALQLRARIGLVTSQLGLGEFAARSTTQAIYDNWRRRIPKRSPRTPTRCGRPACSTNRGSGDCATRWRSRPRCRAGRTGWPRRWRRSSKLDEALDEVQAALRSSRRATASSTTPPAPSRAHAPLRSGRGGLQQLRQPAAQQGPQRQGAVVEGADPLPARRSRDRSRTPSTTTRAAGCTPSTSGSCRTR